MTKVTNNRGRKARTQEMSQEAQGLLLMSQALGEQMMALMQQVATTPRGMGVATCALAMAWATLKDAASIEGLEVEKLFKSEVKYWTINMND